MGKIFKPDGQRLQNLLIVLFSVLLAIVYIGTAQALTLNVMGVDNCPPLQNTSDTCTTAATKLDTDFRWQVEEDKTYHVPLNGDGTVQMTGDPLVPAIDPNWRVGDPNRNTVSVSFHHSYMPVVANGNQDDIAALTLDSTKNYFISILPDPVIDEATGATIAAYSLGGAPIKAGQADVTVYVNKNPIPTAQVTIFVHEDIAPINNVWDLGETGLEGFAIILEDAGGKYGASAGIQSQDAFGNLLCTTYQFVDTNGDGVHNPGELYVYDADGNPIVEVLGSGCVTGPDGTVTIRNLAPGKYGVLAVPPNAVETPTGSGNFVSSIWTQTSTIEGKKLIDAWVKANEPAFFGEFGPPGPHVSIGFVPAGPNDPYIDASVLTGGATISGQVVNLHLSRPPDTAFYNGGPFPHTTPWVGLNLGAAGLGRGVYAARANGDGSFSIPNVPVGSYQLVVWDDNLDLLFAKSTVVVNDENSCNTLTSCNLGDVPVFQWFARMEHYVFNDENEDGFNDGWTDLNGDGKCQSIEGECPMLEQNVNLRWRDGTIYQAFATDSEGVAPFDEVFPFFSWLVSEVDFARFKATGATVVVDDGGPVTFDDPWTFDGVLNPQRQGDPADLDSDVTDTVSRTELGPVLTEAFQAFLGQTNVVQWGKKAYEPGENGGISGMVMYAVTRAEDDPELAAAEPWEPGIPRVTVNLYDSAGATLLATTETDNWDDSLPENCQYGSNAGSTTDAPFVFRGKPTDCYDGMRNWNQVRPGVFDGGYAFGPEFSCTDDFGGTCPDWINVPDPINFPDVGYIKSAKYVVEVIPPTGYEIIRSQDRNVDFGDNFFPSPEALPPPCVGADYVVPAELSLFPGEPAPFAGDTMKTCDRKLVSLSDGANAAADFFLFTEVPIAGHFIGFILDDTANEFDPASPQFGEKYAPPFLPVSIRDWTGREISRTVSDEYGVYNALIPSTFTENLGQPSGISPNMLTTCMNARTKPNPDYPNIPGSPQFVDDPLHNPQYSQFCYTFQYMPGSTTYLDTPVVPVAAFAGPDQNPLDCEFVDGTPRIHSVSVGSGGPYIPTVAVTTGPQSGRGVFTDGEQTLIIKSMGAEVEVPNPAYGGVGSTLPGTTEKTIFRDYSFGENEGTVTIGDLPLVNVTWGEVEISATVPGGTKIDAVGGRQLTVTRADGLSTITGVTVQVGLREGSSVRTVSDGDSIQTAINNAGANDLILVGPGTYNEMVIMWKPVQLQGWGEGSTTIDAIKTPFEKLTAWRILAESKVTNNDVDLAPGQELGFGGIEPATFFSEEGAGVFVLAKSGGDNRFHRARNQGARIDGFTIMGADTGGGVVLNGYADYMDISNNRIVNNSAFFAGGVRVGHPMLTVQQGNNITYSDSDNDMVRIHHNTINQNGGLDGAGGGVALHTGSDSYQVTDNFVCGNFTTADGAGIAHYGFSDDGLIKDNTVLFNENFNQGISVNGGGILISGMPPFGCPIDPVTGVADPACLADPVQVLSPGSGSVRVEANLIQGNSAGAGDGAGIRLSRINGRDMRVQGGGNNQRVSVDWTINVINNMIVDNVAALAGGGISLQDALDVNILHNTIANNDNASTAGDAFTPGIPSQSNPQPGAGIVSRAHSAGLAQFLPGNVPGFSDVNLVDNIIWQNRKFFWELNDNVIPAVSGLCPDLGTPLLGLTCDPDGAAGPLPSIGNDPVYDDLAVIGTAGTLTCTDCVVSTPVATAGDPAFVASYFNGNRNTTIFIPEGTTSMQAPPAFDEGGNFIRLRYGPLTQIDSVTGALFGDYHICAGAGDPSDRCEATSSALNAVLTANVDPAVDGFVNDDFDGEPRPSGNGYDIGADEIQP